MTFKATVRYTILETQVQMNVGGRVNKKMFVKTLALTSLGGDNASVVFTACSAEGGKKIN